MRGQPHFIQHIMRIGIRADPHIHAISHVAPQITQSDAAARKNSRAMRNRGAGFRQPLQIGFRVPACGRMIIQENPMADDRAFPKQTKRIQPSDRRCAMPARDFVKFHHGLRRMHLPGKPALIGLSPTILQKPGRAGINLRWHHHAKKTTAFMLFSAFY